MHMHCSEEKHCLSTKLPAANVISRWASQFVAWKPSLRGIIIRFLQWKAHAIANFKQSKSWLYATFPSLCGACKCLAAGRAWKKSSLWRPFRGRQGDHRTPLQGLCCWTSPEGGPLAGWSMLSQNAQRATQHCCNYYQTHVMSCSQPMDVTQAG